MEKTVTAKQKLKKLENLRKNLCLRAVYDRSNSAFFPQASVENNGHKLQDISVYQDTHKNMGFLSNLYPESEEELLA